MCTFFTIAMHFVSELLVSTKRMDDFFRLPEVSKDKCMKEMGSQKGEIVIRDGNYGWYSTEGVVDKGNKHMTITQWILAKVYFVNIAHCMTAIIDLEDGEDEAQIGDPSSYSNVN